MCGSLNTKTRSKLKMKLIHVITIHVKCKAFFKIINCMDHRLTLMNACQQVIGTKVLTEAAARSPRLFLLAWTTRSANS